MKTRVLLLGLFFLFPILSWTQPYEITEVDIFSLKKPVTARDITVYGISIDNSLQEALDKFKKNVSDLSFAGELCFLEIKPGLKFRSVDKKTIDAIIIFPEFKKNLKGKTANFFDLITAEDLERFVSECFGKPDYKNSLGGNTEFGFDDFLYLNGFYFERSFWTGAKGPVTQPMFILLSREAVKSKVKAQQEPKEVTLTSEAKIGYRDIWNGLESERDKVHFLLGARIRGREIFDEMKEKGCLTKDPIIQDICAKIMTITFTLNTKLDKSTIDLIDNFYKDPLNADVPIYAAWQIVDLARSGIPPKNIERLKVLARKDDRVFFIDEISKLLKLK